MLVEVELPEQLNGFLAPRLSLPLDLFGSEIEHSGVRSFDAAVKHIRQRPAVIFGAKDSHIPYGGLPSGHHLVLLDRSHFILLGYG